MSDHDVQILQGALPAEKPPRVVDFEDLDRKSVDNLVDYMKYVATASGITMGFYGKVVADSVGGMTDSVGKLIVFSPIFFWFSAVFFSVIGIFPRTYRAHTDFEKEVAIIRVRKLKSQYAIFAVLSFLAGFLMFSYSSAAQLWRLFPYDEVATATSDIGAYPSIPSGMHAAPLKHDFSPKRVLLPKPGLR